MDLFDQHAHMEKTGQWRFTPPTHVVAALAEALAQYDEEGGQPARLARYTQNCRTLVGGMARLGFKPFLHPQWQAPIIVTFHAPQLPAYEFKAFYAEVKRRGFILYPGKLTQVETFRVGCSGAIGTGEMQQAVNAIGDAMQALGLKPFLPASLQAPIIVTFHAPAHPAYEFRAFYEAAKKRGFILYPGKLTQVETFRVGCIGAIGTGEMQQAVNAIGDAMQALGMAPAH